MPRLPSTTATRTTRRLRQPRQRVRSSSNGGRCGRISAALGKFRGGLGVAQQVHMRKPANIYSRMERTICAPWGLHGGDAALANRISILRNDGIMQRFPTGKIKPTDLAEGEGFLVETAGGGGFWNPLERDPERVLADVRSG